MKRRTLLAGLGASAAGSAILFGSGAFTQVEAERDLTIGVDEDSNALLALEAGEVASVFSDSGELVIDTDELSSGNEGFNVNSSVLIGETEQDIVNRSPGEAEVVADLGSAAGGTGAAFRLTNNFDDTVDAGNRIDVGINLEDVDAGDSSLTFIISKYSDGGSRDESSDSDFTVSDGSQVVVNDLKSGDELYFAIEIETGSATQPDDIVGDITFRAGPNLKNGFPTSPVQADNRVVNVTQDTTFSSISEAIDPDNADPGDLIQAGSKTYNENVTVDVEGLTLEGPNAGTPGDSNTRGSEATITQGIEVNASGVTLDGLDVTNDDVNGIVITEAPSDVTVANTVVRDITGGTAGASKGVGNGINLQFNDVFKQTSTGIEVTNNLITDVTTPDASGTDPDADAIGVQLLPRGNDVVDLRIANNTIENIEPGTASGGRSEARAVSIATQFTDTSDGTRGDLGQATNLTVADNDVSNLTANFARAVNLFEDKGGDTTTNDALGPVNFTVTGNTVTEINSTDGSLPDLAMFVGEYGNFGADHSVQNNDFDAAGIENFGDSDALDVSGNTFSGDTNVYYLSANANLDTVFNDNDFQVDVVVGDTAITQPPTNDEVLNVDQVASFDSIQTAVDNANAGNTIAVGPGEFQGPVQVTDDQTNLTIRSTGGPENTVINATDGSARSTPSFDAQAVRISVDGVTIDGFNIVGDDTIVSGVFVAGRNGGGDNVRVVNNIIQGMSRPGFGGPSDNSAGIATSSAGFRDGDLPRDERVVNGFVARDNTIKNIGSDAKKPNNPDDGTRAQGISLIDIAGDTAGDGAVIENNTISGLAGEDTTRGIAVQPLDRPVKNGPNLAPGVVVRGNDISDADIGLALGDEDALKIANNIFTDVGDEIVRPS